MEGRADSMSSSSSRAGTMMETSGRIARARRQAARRPDAAAGGGRTRPARGSMPLQATDEPAQPGRNIGQHHRCISPAQVRISENRSSAMCCRVKSCGRSQNCRRAASLKNASSGGRSLSSSKNLRASSRQAPATRRIRRMANRSGGDEVQGLVAGHAGLLADPGEQRQPTGDVDDARSVRRGVETCEGRIPRRGQRAAGQHRELGLVHAARRRNSLSKRRLAYPASHFQRQRAAVRIVPEPGLVGIQRARADRAGRHAGVEVRLTEAVDRSVDSGRSW